MKKILFFVIFSLFTFHFSFAANAAITPTPSPTPTPERVKLPLDQQINSLKDRIASRVAQLKLVERRGIIGTVTEVSDTQLTLTDLQNNTRFVDVDELTKFSSPSAKGNFGISDITKGSKLGVLGLYNKQSRRLLARFVDVISEPKTIQGAIYGINKEDFTFKVMTENGQTLTIDVENITKTSSYTKDAGLTKAGFSKLQEGQRVYIVGFPDVKESNRILASRVIFFPLLPKNPKIVLPANAAPAINPNETVTPSTGSGKKLTPITR